MHKAKKMNSAVTINYFFSTGNLETLHVLLQGNFDMNKCNNPISLNQVTCK